MSNAVARIDFTKEQLAVIESQFFPAGTTKAEQQYCFFVAKELGLNPITREIHFVRRRSKVNDTWVSKVEPMVGRDGFLSIAHRSNQLAGIETASGLKNIPQLENGTWVEKIQLVAECTVWRKDSRKPFTVQVAYNEYCQKTTDGYLTRFWYEKPETMLKKVAESQALRKAFNIHGVYCPEEMGAGFELANGDIVPQTIEADYTSIEGEKSHLSIVKPQQTETPPAKRCKSQPVPPQPVPDDEAGVSDSPPSKHAQVIDELALEVIALLDGKHIAYDINIDGIDGIISANSFNEKELLKSSGFRWSPDQKLWIYKFRNEPF